MEEDGAPGAAGQSCNATKFNTGLDSGVVIRCGGAVVDTLRDGEKGETGATGRPGSAGSSCTGEKISGGVVIRCGGVVVDTLRNGENGSSILMCEGFQNGVAVTTLYDPDYSLCDNRDGKTYKYVQIGTQKWMAQNLNHAIYRVQNPAIGGCLGGETDSCDVYGTLYTWAAAMDSAGYSNWNNNGCGNGKTCTTSGTVKGICPQGWHLPTADEWSTMVIYVGGAYGATAGTKLKAKRLWSKKGGTDGTDNYGFAGLPAGVINASGTFDYSAKTGFWMAAETGKYYARLANLNDERISSAEISKSSGLSVRCVKD